MLTKLSYFITLKKIWSQHIKLLSDDDTLKHEFLQNPSPHRLFGGPTSLGYITRCLSTVHKDDCPSRQPRRWECQGHPQAAARLVHPQWCLTAHVESGAGSPFISISAVSFLDVLNEVSRAARALAFVQKCFGNLIHRKWVKDQIQTCLSWVNGNSLFTFLSDHRLLLTNSCNM